MKKKKFYNTIDKLNSILHRSGDTTVKFTLSPKEGNKKLYRVALLSLLDNSVKFIPDASHQEEFYTLKECLHIISNKVRVILDQKIKYIESLERENIELKEYINYN